MDNAWQTWAALAVVVITALLLARSWWRGRGRHEGCELPATRAQRDWLKVKRRISRRP